MQVEGHPDRLANWSDDCVKVEREGMALDYTGLLGETWADNTMLVYQATCGGCGQAHYLEQSAVSGDWS